MLWLSFIIKIIVKSNSQSAVPTFLKYKPQKLKKTKSQFFGLRLTLRSQGPPTPLHHPQLLTMMGWESLVSQGRALLLSSPGPSLSPSPKYGPRADTIITWASHTTQPTNNFCAKNKSCLHSWLTQLKKLTRWTARTRTWVSPTCSRRSLSINPNF